jgi:hypothetical protein
MRLQGATARPFAAEGVVRSGRLVLLEMSGDRIHSMNPDGSLVNGIARDAIRPVKDQHHVTTHPSAAV